MSNRLYALSDDREKPVEAKLLYVTSAKYGNDWHSTPHTHYFTEFFYVLRGEGRFLVEDTTFPVKENDMVIINPNIPHTEMSLSDRPLEYIVLGIDGLFFSFQQPGAPEGYTVFSFREQRERILFYLNTLLREAETDLPYRDAVCQNILELLIILMIRLTDFGMEVASSRRASVVSSHVKRLIDQRYQEPLTLDQLAEAVHVSKYYLSHAFTEDYGIAPINYLIAKRIEESRNLLSTTDYSISQVANFTGFSSQSYFSQSFRKFTGVTPAEYRRQVKKNGQG